MKILLVTGGSRGIGAEICSQAAREGWAICVNYANSNKEAKELVEEIQDSGGRAIAIAADVSNEGEVEKMFT